MSGLPAYPRKESKFMGKENLSNDIIVENFPTSWERDEHLYRRHIEI
jgi:hypothetical protein